MKKRDIIAERYQTADPGDPAQQERVTLALKMLAGVQLPSPFTLLDAGCRDGAVSLVIKDRFPDAEITGIDLSPKTAEAARKKGFPVEICNLDEDKLPFENHTFDVIYAGDLIEHLYDTDHFFEESQRLLKPGGFLLLSTPNLASWHNRFIFLPLGWQPSMSEVGIRKHLGRPFISVDSPPPGHIHLFVWRSLKEMLERHGFEIVTRKGTTKTGNPFLKVVDTFFARVLPSMAAGFVVMSRKRNNDLV